MDGQVIEVEAGTLNTFAGEKVEVRGGAYFSPQAYLTTAAELQRLEQIRAEERSLVLPMMILGAAFMGLAAGFWLGRSSDDE